MKYIFLLLMSEIPFFVTINKPNKHKIQVKIVTDTGTSLKDVQNKIIYLMQEELSVFNDLPDEYNNFVSECWYKDISADAEPFEYKVFNDGKWSCPWSQEVLYEMVYDILHKLELLGAFVSEANKEPDVFDEEDASMEI